MKTILHVLPAAYLLCVSLATTTWATTPEIRPAVAKRSPIDMPLLIENDWLRQATAPAPPAGTGPQSTTAEQDAAGACDGLKNGKWGFHTDQEDKPWWQVDLLQPAVLDRVVIFNRCDTGAQAASRIMVLLSDDAQHWKLVYQHNGTTFHGQPDNKPLSVELHDARARYVRLQLPQRAFFYLDEVEIYASGNEANIALRKPALQSSTSQWSAPPAPLSAASKASGPPIDRRALLAALKLAQKTLVFVSQDEPRPELAKELSQLEKKIESAGDNMEADLKGLYLETRRLRRRMILSHPLLDFERLLINKRPPPGFSHQSDQYLGRYSGPGPGLVVLDSWKDNPKETVLLEGKLPVGSVLHPDLSFDATRLMFSFCDHSIDNRNLRRFFIYEVGIDGTGLRQVTGTAADPMEGVGGRQSVLIEDFDPCFLPDGGFAFVSTRNQGGVRCHHGGRYCPTYTLYRAAADGTDIHPMVFGEANEWDPSVLPDGRIIWTRWDYINRHDTLFQSLWTIRPDGTGTAHFYGNYSRNPCSIAEARAIPGSHKVVGTATAHHSYTNGSIIMIDPRQGQDGEAPLTRITPEVPFPETEGWPRSSYATPYPLSEEIFLVAYSPYNLAKQGSTQQHNAYGVYLIDTLGGRELIYRDPHTSCFTPTPVKPRRKPPVLPSSVASKREEKSGTFFVNDVYRSSQPIPPGSVKRLRVVQLFPQTTQRVPDRSVALFETAKRILGTVPVAEDGSEAFRAPAGVPLLFQLLDENGMAVMGMRSFVYLQPGESVSCIGCHEPRSTSPTVAPTPENIVFRDLEPSVGPRYEGGLSFARTVQPVLDRYCIDCHGLGKIEDDINLLGTITTGPVKLGTVHASTAYHALTTRKGLVSVALRNRETDYSKPGDYYARAGRLAKILLEGDAHHDRLDRDNFQRIVDWLDLNGQFFGDYSWNKAEWRQPSPEGEKALRDHIRQTCGPELAGEPYAALVNVTLPSESRILNAPLAVEAGGWGQFAEFGWSHTNDPGYRKMRQLVEASITPLSTHDVAGTCNRDPCVCGGCWVRKARRKIDAASASPRPIGSGAATPVSPLPLKISTN